MRAHTPAGREKRTRSRMILVMGAPIFALALGMSASGALAGVVTTDQAQPDATAPFDCSRIAELGIDKQVNFHAGHMWAHCLGLPALRAQQAPSGAGTSANAPLGPSLGGSD